MSELKRGLEINFEQEKGKKILVTFCDLTKRHYKHFLKFLI